MKLYLVQHGEACSVEEDPERPITEKGKADVNRLAVFLRKSGVSVERVIHSGKLRAKQTAERLANAIANGIKLETSELIKPNDNPEAFSQLSYCWATDTLVVGHMPFMARLVSQLTHGSFDILYANFTPGSIVCLNAPRITAGSSTGWSSPNWSANPFKPCLCHRQNSKRHC